VTPSVSARSAVVREGSLELDKIQGNALPGFNKDYQAFLFVRFATQGSGAQWLRTVHPQLASAAEVEAFRAAFKSVRDRRPPEASDGRDGGALRAISATWINLAITFAGLRQIGADGTARFPRAFRLNRVPGLPEAAIRSDVHALLIIAADYESNLSDELERQRQQLPRSGVEEVLLLRGGTLPGEQRGHEHFGFKDGISQPHVAGTQWGSGPEVAPGEFILGERDQAGAASGAELPGWTRNASYVAFLQLEQHVETFWNAMRDQARQFGVAPEELATWIVGRKHDAEGTPASPTPSRLSHIGRGYARGLPAGEALRRRLLRRGIPYGAPASGPQSADTERGLHFISYQADLERQFEHVWADWLNGPTFPVPGAGRDAFVGQSTWSGQTGLPMAARRTVVERTDQRGGMINLSLPAFVTPRYGSYFIAPAIDAVAKLAR
jgi:Dyp-type peroxidase family